MQVHCRTVSQLQVTNGLWSWCVLLPLLVCGSDSRVLADDAPTAGSDVVFEALALDDPVTFMEFSDDGRYLALTHQAESAVTIYDVQKKHIASTLETPTPRSVLWRNGQLIVADSISGMIRVFSEAKDWKRLKEVRIPKASIVHISAPRGSAFKGEASVTCHGTGVSASYRDSLIFAANIGTGAIRLISKAALATASFDSRFIVTQGSFNLSPSDVIAGYSYSEFVRGQSNARQVFRGGHAQTPFVYQVQAGGYLIGLNVIFGGVPLTPLESQYGDVIIPDVDTQGCVLPVPGSDQCASTEHRTDATGTSRCQIPRTVRRTRPAVLSMVPRT